MAPSPTQLRQWEKSFTLPVLSGVVALAFIGSAFHERPQRGSRDLDIDQRFNLPRPPIDLPYSQKNNIICMVLMTITGLVAVLLGARDARRSRSLLPLVLPLSGAVIALPETFIDVLGCIYYPWSEKNASIHILGREMPPWIAIWFGYGALMQMGLRLLQQNATTRTLWWFLGAMMVSDLLIEEILLPMGVYHYYGNQPLVVFNLFPWWWMAPNSVGVFLATALAYRWKDLLVSWRSFAVFLLTPMSVGAIYGLITFPAWVAVNDDWNWFLTDVLGMLTLLLGGAAFCGVLDLVLGRHPFDLDGNGVHESESSASQERDETFHDDC